MTAADERQNELETTPIWQLTQSRYQYLKGIKQPHILEISLLQMSRFSKRGLAQYQQQRAKEWDASGDCKVEYNHLVWEAYQRGEFTEQSEGVSDDAKTAVYYGKREAKEHDTAERMKEAQAENVILSVCDAEIGDTIYALYGSRYVKIIGKFRTSFKVQALSGGDTFTVKARACQWLHHNELVKAVEERKPINPHRATEPETDPEPPTPAGAAHFPNIEQQTATGAVARTMPTNTTPAPKQGVSMERAAEIIREEMNKHGLIARGWTYRLGRACKEFGSCNEKRKLLTFSAPIAALNTEDDLREVACHEIAHAKAGQAAGHGRVWQAMALACGANPKRTCGSHIIAPDNKYHATCGSCGTVCKMTRPPKRVMCCNRCVTKHINPYMSRTRKIEIHDRFTLTWIEQATGRSGQKKADFEQTKPEAANPVEQREPEVWNAKPITRAIQPSLF